MENLRRHFGLAVLMSEVGHVFCCVLPTIFTVLSFAANIGLIGLVPTWMMSLHARIHHYEVPIIVFSAVMLVLGWAALSIGSKVDCHETGCEHGACSNEKTKNKRIMIIATCLFVTNILIYTVVHKNIFHLDMFSPVHVVHREGQRN